MRPGIHFSNIQGPYSLSPGVKMYPKYCLLTIDYYCQLREQRQPLFILFINLTKAFDLVSRDVLFRILAKIGFPPKLLSVIQSFHTDIKDVMQFDDASLEAFSIRSGVTAGLCDRPNPVLAFSLLSCLRPKFARSQSGKCSLQTMQP